MSNVIPFWTRVAYKVSDRHFKMENCISLELEIDKCSAAPIGGTTVNMYAEDGQRYVQVAWSVDQFFELVEDAVSKFCRLDIEYAQDVEDAQVAMDDRNAFLRDAIAKHPNILMEMSRMFRRLTNEAEEASVRLSAMSPRL